MAWNEKSVLFDGVDEYVQCGALGYGNFQQCTVSAWVKLNSIGGNQFIVDESGSGAYGGGIIMYVNNSGNVVFAGQDLTPAPVSTTTLLTGVWYHCVGTMDGVNDNIYINGVLEDSASRSVGARITKNLRIGDSEQFGGPFDGNIDEVLIFTSPLSASDILDIYNGGEPKDESARPTLDHWWRMGDSDTYPTLTDNAGSLDGTMTNQEAGDIEEDVPVGTSPVWQGGTNEYWNEATNWSTGTVPTASTPATFDGDESNADCTVDVAINVVNLTIRDSYSGTITNATYDVTLAGSWTQDTGTYEGGSGDFSANILNISGGKFTMTTGEVDTDLAVTGGEFLLNSQEASRNTDPGIANVLTGVAYKILDVDLTGTFDEAARNVDPGIANVKTGEAYKIQGVDLVGTYAGAGSSIDPGIANVLLGVNYEINGTPLTGTFDEAARNTDPGVANVIKDVVYKILNISYTGEYGEVPVPATAGYVRSDFGTDFLNIDQEFIIEEMTVTVAYKRGTATISNLSVILGPVVTEYDDATGIDVAIGDGSFWIKPDDLNFGDGPFEAAMHDKITDSLGQEWDVIAPGTLDPERCMVLVPVVRMQYVPSPS